MKLSTQAFVLLTIFATAAASPNVRKQPNLGRRLVDDDPATEDFDAMIASLESDIAGLQQDIANLEASADAEPEVCGELRTEKMDLKVEKKELHSQLKEEKENFLFVMGNARGLLKEGKIASSKAEKQQKLALALETAGELETLMSEMQTTFESFKAKSKEMGEKETKMKEAGCADDDDETSEASVESVASEEDDGQ